MPNWSGKPPAIRPGDRPNVVGREAQRWLRESPTAETAWIVRHALRALVKQGDRDALTVLGATGGEHARVVDLSVSPRAISLGDAVSIEFTLENADSATHELTVDYVVHHVRTSGRVIPKVFKLAGVRLGPGERRPLRKSHRVKPMTTRAYHPGQHVVDIQVNGVVLASSGFDLLP